MTPVALPHPETLADKSYSTLKTIVDRTGSRQKHPCQALIEQLHRICLHGSSIESQEEHMHDESDTLRRPSLDDVSKVPS